MIAYACHSPGVEVSIHDTEEAAERAAARMQRELEYEGPVSAATWANLDGRAGCCVVPGGHRARGAGGVLGSSEE